MAHLYAWLTELVGCWPQELLPRPGMVPEAGLFVNAVRQRRQRKGIEVAALPRRWFETRGKTAKAKLIRNFCREHLEG